MTITSHLKPLLQHYYLPLLTTVIVTVIMLLGSGTKNWLRFDRIAILDGEIWRIVSAHFAHLTPSHALMNILGLLLCWLLFGKQLRALPTLAVMILSAVGISLALLVFNPELRWYVGLSGVLHALFIHGVLLEIRAGRRDSLVLLVFIVGKLIWEQVAGPLPGSEETAGGHVIVDSHLYGACFGLLLSVPLLIKPIKQGARRADSTKSG